jgi:hypothetical protein
MDQTVTMTVIIPLYFFPAIAKIPAFSGSGPAGTGGRDNLLSDLTGWVPGNPPLSENYRSLYLLHIFKNYILIATKMKKYMNREPLYIDQGIAASPAKPAPSTR